MSRMTKRERRRVGRAIRKARREARAAVVVVHAIRWDEVYRVMLAGADVVASAFRAFTDVVVQVVTEAGQLLAWNAAEARRARRDWMLTHRALERGPRA